MNEMPMAQAIQWQAMQLLHLGNKINYNPAYRAREERKQLDKILNG